jgi:hypothetical protein
LLPSIHPPALRLSKRLALSLPALSLSKLPKGLTPAELKEQRERAGLKTLPAIDDE